MQVTLRVAISNPMQVTIRVATSNPTQATTTVGTFNSSKVTIKAVHNSHNKEVIILGVVKDFVSFAPAQIMFWYNVLVLSYLGVEEMDQGGKIPPHHPAFSMFNPGNYYVGCAKQKELTTRGDVPHMLHLQPEDKG